MKRTKIRMNNLAAILLAAAAVVPAAAQSSGAASAAAPTAAEVLRKVDRNQAFTSIEYEARMEIRLQGKLRVKTMKAVAVGADKAFVEFTNPEDQGTRYLKLADELWMYFPKEDDSIKISGHLLKEGMMGSDISYEDALESDDLALAYDAKVTGKEELDGRPVWVLELTAKSDAARYAKRVLRVDAERWVVLSSGMYAKSGKLLKESRSLEVRLVGGRWYPVKTELSDKLRKDSSTTFTLVGLVLDPKIDEKRFSLAELRK
jgi:outer membrane lipoprotein-sorting protein